MEPSILLNTGAYFDFLNPREADFSIEDIATGLANTCRFGGQSRRFYSVAQHSVLVSRLVSPENAFFGLMHDAHEALIGDIPSPLKQLLPDFKELEDRIERVVLNKYGLSGSKPHEVKQADLVALATEKRDLMQHDTEAWLLLDGIKPDDAVISPQSPGVARREFLCRFAELRQPKT